VGVLRAALFDVMEESSNAMAAFFIPWPEALRLRLERAEAR
jgi:hypothetical protein